MRRRMLLLHFTPTDFRCHSNELWDKMGYKSACVRDFREILSLIKGFSGMGRRMLPIAFLLKRPMLPWLKNLGQNGL